MRRGEVKRLPRETASQKVSIQYFGKVSQMTTVRSLVGALILVMIRWSPLLGAEPTEVSYYKQIRPILQQHCQGCHQPAKPQGGFVMTGHADLFKPGESDVA